ncbi:MAG: putative transaldolase [candidate division TM6 bacterium GW2011_GWA2_36_9]|nr:MAG: putative transaldolase [candidate division TM6 bacterium GW2011_GWA2_36_9]
MKVFLDTADMKKIVPGDISVEITEKSADKVYLQAQKISKIAKNIVVKIPCHADYYEIIKKLVKEKIQINITLVFSLAQALFMCKLGVKYISPFIGRLDDIGADGTQLLYEIRDMIDNYGYSTQIIAASIRSIDRFNEAIMAIADVATIPSDVFEKSLQHPLTDSGMEKFLSDWKKTGIKQFP